MKLKILILIAVFPFIIPLISAYNYVANDNMNYKFNSSGVYFSLFDRNKGKLDIELKGTYPLFGSVTYRNFNWTWKNYTKEEIRECEGDAVSPNDECFYTVDYVEGYNNNLMVNITPIFKFHEANNMKFSYHVKSNFISTVDNVEYSIKLNMEEDKNIYQRGNIINLNDLEFRYNDLIENNFTLLNGFNDNGKVLLNFIDTSGDLQPEETKILDPELTGFKSPTITGVPFDEWTNCNNVISNDANYATTNTLRKNCSASGYDFSALSDTALIHGIYLKEESYKTGVGTKPVGCHYLSWDNGTSWTARDSSKCRIVGFSPSITTFGSGSDNWGHSWTADEVKNHFASNIQYDSATLGTPTLNYDFIQVQINYTNPVPDAVFSDPMPEDESIISSSLFENISSENNVSMTHCRDIVYYPSYLKNNYMPTNESLLHCERQIGGEWGFDNGTRINITGLGYNEEGGDFTAIRNYNVSSTNATLTYNNFLNNTYVNLYDEIVLNFSIEDADSDYITYYIYGDNTTEDLFDSPLDFQRLVLNGTYLYNWTSLPIKNTSKDLYALYHLDNRWEWNEPYTSTISNINDRKIYDFSGNGHTGTYYNAINGSSMDNDIFFTEEGYFGGGFALDGYQDFIQIGNDTDFSDFCNNGCSISTWIKRANSDTVSSSSIIGRDDSTDNNRFFYMNLGSAGGVTSAVFSIWANGTILGDGGQFCTAFDTSVPVNRTDKWYHLTGVYNLTDVMIYIDSKLIEATACNFVIDQDAWGDNEDTFIGLTDDSPSSLDLGFNGTIDEVGMWNRSLSEAEIEEMYSLGEGTYYWHITAQDSRNQIDIGEVRQFTIHPLCYYDALEVSSINKSVDCQENNLTFFNRGDVNINADMFNWEQLIIKDSKLILHTPYRLTSINR